MKCQFLSSGKYKRNITKLLFAELVQRVVKVKQTGKAMVRLHWCADCYGLSLCDCVFENPCSAGIINVYQNTQLETNCFFLYINSKKLTFLIPNLSSLVKKIPS